jgi:hypothetical protein
VLRHLVAVHPGIDARAQLQLAEGQPVLGRGHRLAAVGDEELQVLLGDRRPDAGEERAADPVADLPVDGGEAGQRLRPQDLRADEGGTGLGPPVPVRQAQDAVDVLRLVGAPERRRDHRPQHHEGQEDGRGRPGHGAAEAGTQESHGALLDISTTRTARRYPGDARCDA